MIKRCTKCREEKERDAFPRHVNMKDGLSSWCKFCHNEHTKLRYRARRAAQPEELRAEWRANSAGHKMRNAGRYAEYARNIQLRNKFGITLDDFDSLLRDQDGKCAICLRADSGRRDHKNLSVDHCHTTGIIRGLLCDPCNKGIGHFWDRPDLLDAAASYLRLSLSKLKGVSK